MNINAILPIIIVFAFWFVVMFIVGELVTLIVYGRWLSDEQIRKAIGNNLHRYTLNEFDKKHKLLHGSYVDENDIYRYQPYISTARSLFCRWYIQDVGCVPRWSIYSKAIDNLHARLIAEINNESTRISD